MAKQQLSKKQSEALVNVKTKVTELQEAINTLDGLFDFNSVGLQEWIEDLDETLSEIDDEIESDD